MTTSTTFDTIIKQDAILRDGAVVNYNGQYSSGNYMVGDIVSLENKYLSLTGACNNPNTEPPPSSTWKAITGLPLLENENYVLLNNSSMSGDISTITQVGTGQYHFTTPNQVQILSFYMVAGGGSGGGGAFLPPSANASGGGGGSGNILTFYLPVTPGQVLYLEVGKGGQGAENVTENGNPGGRTRVLFNDQVLFTTLGGNGGLHGFGQNPEGGSGFYGGGAGISGTDPTPSSGGIGIMENGGNSTFGESGAGGGEGGPTIFVGEFGGGGGGGGPGGGNPNDAMDGSLPGAGGAGQNAVLSGPSPAGADGQIIITW